MPGTVRNMLTLGGPHMGVDAVPQCASGLMCDVINFVIKRLVYMSIAQDWIAPAGYFRDVNNLETYDKKSVFLPAVNNEISQDDFDSDFAELRQSRFASLNQAMLVKFDQDTMLYPRETAWFQQVDKHGKLLPLNATDFYNQDWIGLKQLNDAGKVHFVSFPGNHLQFTEDDIKETLIPFLK